MSVKINKSLSDGLVLHLPMNEGSGSTVYDRSKNGNNGAITSATWVVDAEKGKCLSFDGVNDHVDINSVDFGLSTELTVSTEIKTDTSQVGRGFVIKHTADYDWMLYFYASGFTFFFKDSAGTVEALDTSFIYYDDVFHTFTATFDGSTIKLFIDGVEKASKTSAISNVRNASTNFRAGYGFGGYFKGVIRNVRVYNRGLSGDEVSALYRLGENKSLDDGLVLDMPLNEGSGSTVFDKSKYSNNGTVNGATWTTDAEVGECLSFDGLDDYIKVIHNSTLNVEYATVSAWIKLSKNPATGHNEIISKNWNILRFYIDGTKNFLHIHLSVSGSSTGLDGTTALENGKWYHVAFTFDGTTMRLYVNGNLDSAADKSGTLDVNTADLLIGKFIDTSLLNGVIKDMRIFSRALSESEINQLYRLTKKGVE